MFNNAACLATASSSKMICHISDKAELSRLALVKHFDAMSTNNDNASHIEVICSEKSTTM